MLIFLLHPSHKVDFIMTPLKGVYFDYDKTFPPIDKVDPSIVPWFQIQPDPEKFAALLLQFAAGDPVCQALVLRASDQWGVNFSIGKDVFVTPAVQAHYLKQLRNWLSPLSGNLGRVEAHVDDVDEAYDKVWKKFGVLGDMKKVASDKFFSLELAGRRDRVQIYRSMTEAARAIVGEVTTWPSRQVEKLAMLRLMRSPGLMALQRRMLSVIVEERWTEKLNLTNYRKFAAWEYLPYYLRGKVSEKVDDGVAAPRVLGALHDCLAEEEDTRKYVDKSAIAAFMKLEGGKEYARWRLLPPLIRNQVMLSDLARLLPFGKQECSHVRFQFPSKALDALPSLVNFAGWPWEPVVHKTANPQDPGRAFPFASGWSRNELCPSVISSRLVLAPLYAGTSGHSQGRILSWRKVESKNLEDVPVGLVIAAGYSVLWRLYYDKRVSGFHTLFEALQSAFVDTVYKPGKIASCKDDALFDLLLKLTGPKSIDVRSFWVECLKTFGRPGPTFAQSHKLSLVQERDATMKAFPGTVIPHWGETDDPSTTAPEVAVWTDTSNRKAYDEWMLLLAAATPLPDDDDF